MKKVWFIRHGESEANVGNKTETTRDVLLTTTGHLQAQILPSLFEVTPKLIVTSPYLRTKQTASYTMLKFNQVAHEEWPVEEFTYLDQNKWANTTIAERESGRTEYWDIMDPDHFDGPLTESFRHLLFRVEIVLEQIKNSTENFIPIFTHGQFMKTVWWVLFEEILTGKPYEPPSCDKETMKNIYKFFNTTNIPNTAILELEWLDGVTQPKVLLKIEHLERFTY